MSLKLLIESQPTLITKTVLLYIDGSTILYIPRPNLLLLKKALFMKLRLRILASRTLNARKVIACASQKRTGRRERSSLNKGL